MKKKIKYTNIQEWSSLMLDLFSTFDRLWSLLGWEAIGSVLISLLG